MMVTVIINRLSFTYRKYLGVDCKTIKRKRRTKTTIRINENVW